MHVLIEVISTLADMVRENIVEEIKEAGYFSILVDEIKDISKTDNYICVTIP